MKVFPFTALAAWSLALATLPAFSSGDYWVAPTYLDGAGAQFKEAPEFFWHEEVQRLARKYRAPESAGMEVKGAHGPDGFLNNQTRFSGPDEQKNKAWAATTPDYADFEDALKTERLKPADAGAATEAHQNARAAINGGRPLPGGEADSEFADYHTGAAAREAPAARAAWQKLLARPPEERHYRSVWAAFMLGKKALQEKQWPEAVGYFQLCRALAREGFADTPALAADSYGWEGRAELMQRHYPQAARLYLTQLALGDYSAIVSLKRCVPDFYGPGGGFQNGEADAMPPRGSPDSNAHWLEAARDPALQELTTARILCAGEFGDELYLCKCLLEALTKAEVAKVEDAGRLAWVAYHTGDYQLARQWLAKVDAASPVSRWLEARFAARDGKPDAAAKIMREVTTGFPAALRFDQTVPPHDRSQGELGALLYGKGKFMEAFDAFLKGHCEEDVNFMIESVLTPNELNAVLKKMASPLPPGKNADGANDALPAPAGSETGSALSEIRWQIGRRLVREGRIKEARPLFPDVIRQAMDDYIALAVKGESKKTPVEERVEAHAKAGSLMLEQGPQFRGTAQDFHHPQYYREVPFTVRGQRVTGTFYPEAAVIPPHQEPPQRVYISPTAAEKKRLAATAKQHRKMRLTRGLAVSHLLRAAELLPDKSEARAYMLNAAGYWLQDLDNPAADKIYYRIEKDFAHTPTGQAVIQKHWFLSGFYTMEWTPHPDPEAGEN